MMDMRYHCLPRHVFNELAAGGGGAEGIRQLAAAQYSKHLLLLRGVLTATAESTRHPASMVRAAYELLVASQRHDPVAARQVIGYPAVGAWARRTIMASRNGPTMAGAEPARLSAVAAAAAIRTRLPAEIEVPAISGAVMLPSLGVALIEGDKAVVRTTAEGAEVAALGCRIVIPPDPHTANPGWLPIRQIQAGSLCVLLDDLDPFRMPALAAKAPRLTDAEVTGWTAALTDAWLLLRAEHAAIAAEIAAAVTVIVPHVRPPRGHSSSSSSETFGAIAMSEPVDPPTSAATLTHELQHLKLFALLDLIPLAMADDGQRYYAPWRDDPRPLGGLLHGAYAFLGVSGFWRRQRELTTRKSVGAGEEGDAGLYAQAEFARWLTATQQTVETLGASGRLTEAGVEFVARMASTLDGWAAEPVPGQARDIALLEAAEHLTRWRAKNS
jgi:uncharacterized protein